MNATNAMILIVSMSLPYEWPADTGSSHLACRAPDVARQAVV